VLSDRPQLAVLVTFLPVFLQQVAVAKCLLTQRALVRFLARMYYHVTTQVTRAREAFSADLAPVPVETTVEVLVQFQAAACDESLAALGTNPRTVGAGKREL